jgi:hypothetical protein
MPSAIDILLHRVSLTVFALYAVRIVWEPTIFDLLFGSFRNSHDFADTAGSYDGACAQAPR